MTAIEPHSRPFWDALEEGRFVVQSCTDCGESYFPPSPACPHCHSAAVEWTETSGRGTLYSFTRQERTTPGFDSPLVLGIVELEVGPRVLVRIDDTLEECLLGAPVELRPVAYEGGADRGRLADRPFFRGYLASSDDGA